MFTASITRTTIILQKDYQYSYYPTPKNLKENIVQHKRYRGGKQEKSKEILKISIQQYKNRILCEEKLQELSAYWKMQKTLGNEMTKIPPNTRTQRDGLLR